MIILGIDSSAVAVSAAITRDGKLLCEHYCNNGLTHSVTLLPSIASALAECSLTPEDLDLLALAAGPGSFTGLRIGAATVKGLSAGKTPCLGVSTLEAMAWDHPDFDGTICACMDARCNQVYRAFFKDGVRLREDQAVLLPELCREISEIPGRMLLVGDGAALCLKTIEKTAPALLGRVLAAPENRRFQHAYGVCAAAEAALKAGQTPVSADRLFLHYLRLPQAERERIRREQEASEKEIKSC